MENSRISMIAAIGAETRAMGKDGKLIWQGLKSDMQRFTGLTKGNVVIMGKTTWFSLPPFNRPLKDRPNLVVTSDDSDLVKDGKKAYEGAIVVRSVEEAIRLAHEMAPGKEIFLMGGARIYEEGLKLAKRLYVTEVHSDTPGDVYFPEYKHLFTMEVEPAEEVPEVGYHLTFRTLERPE